MSIESNQTTFASIGFTEEWKECCRLALGLEKEVEQQQGHDCEKSECSGGPLQFISLLPSDDYEQEREEAARTHMPKDPWMQTARQVQSNVLNMSEWIRTKRFEFCTFEMPEEEASLIQSTVTSFTATTANEIESLRQLMMDDTNLPTEQQSLYKHGIVQVLLTRLKENIALPFGELQKQRSRAAVKLWNNPLRCHLMTLQRTASANRPTSSRLLIDLDDDRGLKPQEQRFLPHLPSHVLQCNFLASYVDQDLAVASRRPPSRFATSVGSVEQTALPDSPLTRPKAEQQNAEQECVQCVPHDNTSAHGDESRASLQQEAALLTAALHGDLESVQKMEQVMVDITTLLTQFSELVGEQQENVWQIHDAAATTKENVAAGQESLVEAKERTANSKHYMARAITAMALLLLFFHWIRP